MNKYEGVVIFTEKFDTELSLKAISKYTEVLRTYSPTMPTVDNLGKKKLAYPIREQTEGWYVIFKFEARPDNIAELERLFRIDDDVIKFIVVRTETEDDDEDDDSKFETVKPESEQSEPAVIDAEDVLLGLATYN